VIILIFLGEGYSKKGKGYTINPYKADMKAVLGTDKNMLNY
jgi:hypothetical protein